MIKILFLSANPNDRAQLQIQEEFRAIDSAIQKGHYRDELQLITYGAVRPTDVIDLFLRHEPNIVHFSGHGSPTNEIILQDDHGNSSPISTRILERLFEVFKYNVNIKCVILNACYSEYQAQAIANHVDCVIGMSGAISDEASIAFSERFYQALASDWSLSGAFELGCSELGRQSLPEFQLPQLLTHGKDLSSIKLISQQKSTQQRQAFSRDIGIPYPYDINYSYLHLQFETYCNVWKSLKSLRSAGDALWERANTDNLVHFARELGQTSFLVRKGESYFEEKDYKSLSKLLKMFGDYSLGKLTLVEIRSNQDANLLFSEQDIQSRIEGNRKHKEKYERLLERIRASFRRQLTNPRADLVY